jgi:hypothetical protein
MQRRYPGRRSASPIGISQFLLACRASPVAMNPHTSYLESREFFCLLRIDATLRPLETDMRLTITRARHCKGGR